MDMKKSFVISRTDHTVLKQTASRADVEQATLIAARFKAASVCVPPCYVEDAVRAADGQIRVCGVAGFPNGYVSTDAKIFEIAGMLEDGAEEIDVVLNIGALKAGETEYVKTELEALRALTEGYILKVIAETCFLTREEKLLALKLIGDCGADFIKTSTASAEAGLRRRT